MRNRSRSSSQLPLIPLEPHAYRVSEIAARIAELVEHDDILGQVRVQGEISNFTRASSGHLYFSLKDESACIRCVMWRSDAAKLERSPRDGEAVYADGGFSFYPARGDVQLYVGRLLFIGAGLLYQQFLALKRRLEEEGLFDEARKRPLPKFPRRIGIVTSREGAVLRDILHIFKKRYPLPELFLVPCTVQGEAAAPQLVNALNRLRAVRNLDVIILARGGGSFEDLWPFNDERLAHAIVASPVPVISGVGHETDFTIADFCADLRAPTPTAAAQFCTPDQNEVRRDLIQYERRLLQEMRALLADAHQRLRLQQLALVRASPSSRIANRRQQVDDLTHALVMGMRRRLMLERERLRGTNRHLDALNPAATLGRGYALVRRAEDGAPVHSTRQVSAETRIVVRVEDGEFGARVDGEGANA